MGLWTEARVLLDTEISLQCEKNHVPGVSVDEQAQKPSLKVEQHLKKIINMLKLY